MSRRIVVLASRNADKVREMSELCEGMPFEIRSSADYPGLPEVLEDGTTTLGNATRKALATAAYTGEIAVADDTALRVEALGNLPDIFAARFAGENATYADNCRLLSELMAEVPDGRRQALFTTAGVWVDPRPLDRGLAHDADRAQGADTSHRWLRVPASRSAGIDRSAVWQGYLDWALEVGQTPGVDVGRLQEILAELTAPLSHGGRPLGAQPDDLHLPDPRLWAAAGPQDTVRVSYGQALGLPSGAPGPDVSEPLWFELSAVGRVLGEITSQPKGRQGFGYDPVFRPLGGDRSLAEMASDEKNALSHRGRAMRRLLKAASHLYTT